VVASSRRPLCKPDSKVGDMNTVVSRICVGSFEASRKAQLQMTNLVVNPSQPRQNTSSEIRPIISTKYVVINYGECGETQLKHEY
jgi:hypothetical protein